MVKMKLQRPTVSSILRSCVLSLILLVWARRTCVAATGVSIQITYFLNPVTWYEAYKLCESEGKTLVLVDRAMDRYFESIQLHEKFGNVLSESAFRFWNRIAYDGQKIITPGPVDTAPVDSVSYADCQNLANDTWTNWAGEVPVTNKEPFDVCASVVYSQTFPWPWEWVQCSSQSFCLCSRPLNNPCDSVDNCYSLGFPMMTQSAVNGHTLECFSGSAADPTGLTTSLADPTKGKTSVTTNRTIAVTSSTQETPLVTGERSSEETGTPGPSEETVTPGPREDTETPIITTNETGTPGSSKETRTPGSSEETVTPGSREETETPIITTNETGTPGPSKETGTPGPREETETPIITTNETGTPGPSEETGTSHQNRTSASETSTPTQKMSLVTNDSNSTSQLPESTTVEVTTASVPYCKCVQKQVPDSNITSQTTAEEIKKELLVDKTNLSSRRRKKESAPDPRPSSKGIATVAIVFLSIVFGLIFISDFIRKKA